MNENRKRKKERRKERDIQTAKLVCRFIGPPSVSVLIFFMLLVLEVVLGEVAGRVALER